MFGDSLTFKFSYASLHSLNHQSQNDEQLTKLYMTNQWPNNRPNWEPRATVESNDHLSFIHFALLITRIGLAEILQRVSTSGRCFHSWPLAGHQIRQIHHSLAVSPLIVIPGHNLNHIVPHDHGERGVDGR
uniref:Uncharacterized protein n=1 Tax=Opuntia streptacantha TaxID=393608 RepID=A0A7C9DVC0_OPUST